jgi:hypothetical protein
VNVARVVALKHDLAAQQMCVWRTDKRSWIPAFAGMTAQSRVQAKLKSPVKSKSAEFKFCN